MTVKIFFQTLPYLFLRLVVYFVFGLILLFFLSMMGGMGFLVLKVFKEVAAAPLIFIAIFTVPILIALTRFFQRYALYLVRGGHIVVITELVRKGKLPQGENQISYGKDKIAKHFGGASVLFIVDNMVRKAVKQVLNWLTSADGCLGQIPGMNLVLSVIKRVLRIAGNYIDEAVLSYIVSHEEEKNVWKTAADGVILYAQSWKSLLITAVFVSLVVMCIWLAVFGVSLFLLLIPVSTYGGEIAARITTSPQAQQGLKVLFGFIALALSQTIANFVKWITVDPLATVSMIVSYNKAIDGAQPSYDLYTQLSRVSRSFRQMTERAKQLQPTA